MGGGCPWGVNISGSTAPSGRKGGLGYEPERPTNRSYALARAVDKRAVDPRTLKDARSSRARIPAIYQVRVRPRPANGQSASRALELFEFGLPLIILSSKRPVLPADEGEQHD